ncbi:PsbP-related protein [Patescibacteria group bacterium]
MKKIFPIAAAVIVAIIVIWLLVTIQDEGEVVAAAPYEYQYPAGFELSEKNSDGENYQEVYVHSTADATFLTNIWITVIPGTISESLELHAEETLEITRSDPQVENIDVVEESEMPIDGVDGYFLSTILTDNEGSFSQKQVFYEKDDRIVYITFSTSNDAFEGLEPAFDASISTFQLTGSESAIEI